RRQAAAAAVALQRRSRSNGPAPRSSTCSETSTPSGSPRPRCSPARYVGGRAETTAATDSDESSGCEERDEVARPTRMSEALVTRVAKAKGDSPLTQVGGESPAQRTLWTSASMRGRTSAGEAETSHGIAAVARGAIDGAVLAGESAMLVLHVAPRET